MDIGCPDGKDYVKVAVEGAVGTICLSGTVTEEERLLAAPYIWTRVIKDWVGPSGYPPYSEQYGNGPFSLASGYWCATGVNVPDWGDPGAKLTALAWLVIGGVAQGDPKAVFFYGSTAASTPTGGPLTNCYLYPPCSSGSGPGPGGPAMTALAAARARGVVTPGSPEPVPATLHAGFSGGPADLNALTLTLEHIGPVDGHLTWRSNPFRVGSMSSATTLDLVCSRTQPGAWELSAADGGFQAPAKGAAPVISYAPVFTLTFSGIRLNPDWGKGTIAITITP